VPVVVDSRYRLLDYKGLTACTPNESEVERSLDIEIDDDPRNAGAARRTLLRRTGMQAVLITRGSRGMALFQAKQPTIHVAIFGSDEVADVTGAATPSSPTVTMSLRRRARSTKPRALRTTPAACGDEARDRNRYSA
jgi:bifunctional ADP-heptose synthase (sugar kinase/adenylyltransferase)